jgi:putative Mn2+ efflux pump MntP
MGFIEILGIGVALAMDACAVSMTNGMQDSKMPPKKVLLIGLFFGVFQFLMPLIGYYVTGVVANAFLATFEKISSWISFGLLAFLGGKMLFEGICEWKEAKESSACSCARSEKLTYGKLAMQAVATSIDALAVGVALEMATHTDIGLAFGPFGATACIGIITAALSVGAVYIGKAVGCKLADKATLFGGTVLLLVGLKILLSALL